MNLQRSLCILVVLLLLSGSLLGSEPERLLQIRESDLGDLIRGRRVSIHLTEGARIEGRVQEVEAASLVVMVGKSSDPAVYPRGKAQVPRDAVSRIEVRGLKTKRGARIAATAGTFFGTLVGSYFFFRALLESGPVPGSSVAMVGIPTGAAVLVYRALAPKNDVTLIEIVPDSPGGGAPKPETRDTSLNTTIPAETGPLFFEPSRPGRLRQQVLRALMRPDRPLYLPSLSQDGMLRRPGALHRRWAAPPDIGHGDPPGPFFAQSKGDREGSR